MHEFWSRFKLHVAEYFIFTSGEKRGTLSLLFVIIILIAGLVVQNFIPQPTADFTKFKSEIALIKKSEIKDSSDFKPKYVFKYDSTFHTESKNKKSFTESKLFMFDPNTIAEDGWIKLGLSQKQAGVIIKYRSKGTKFHKKEDLRKVFVINDAFYSMIEPYVIIDTTALQTTKQNDSLTYSKNQTYKPVDYKNVIVELNTASQEELDKLPGIGQWIAAGIIKYRDKLGGFVDKAQLLEVKFMTDSLYQSIQKQLIVNPVYVKKVNINTNDFKSLLHPYLDYSTAGLISNYHKLHGSFKSVEDLKTLKLVDKSTFEKLWPYIEAK